MAKVTRGEFLGLASLFAGGVAGGQAPQFEQSRGRGADLVVVNGRVLTSDERQPRAEAFAVKHGRFIAVGANADVRALAGPDTQTIDAAQMTVTPGFIDTHCHPSGVNELFGVNTNLATREQIVAALRKKAAATPPGQWVQGFMYDDAKVAEGPITRIDLDNVSREHPVSVAHRGGHTTVYNSKAFELAGIRKGTPDPQGGRLERDASGELTGKVAELARGVFDQVGKRETPRARSRPRSGPTSTTTAKSERSMAKRRCSGCSRTARSWTRASAYPARRITGPAPSSR